MTTPQIDPEFASLIPPLTPDEYTQLENNLLAEGCRDRLVVWGNILIDGHNRLKICTEHGIPYEATRRDFADRSDAMIFIILNQFGRRNLTGGNRGLLVLKLEPLYKERAKKNQRKSPGRGKKGLQNSGNLFSQVHTDRELARLAGISHNTVEKVRKIVKHGTPEQLERIKRGGKGNSVRAVHMEVKRTQAPDIGAPGESAGRESPPQDDLERIRGYVADLKNPSLDRSLTPEMFLAEYESFAQRFIRSIGVFACEPYTEVYHLLSDCEGERIIELGGSMAEAIERQNLVIKELS